MRNPCTGYEPPKGTESTLIHDIYGDGILVHFPIGDKVSPHNCEIGIRSAQLGMTVEKYLAMVKEYTRRQWNNGN